MLKQFVIFLVAILPAGAFAQLQINDQQSIIDMVKGLEGEGVRIDNITYYIPLENDSLLPPVGTFTDNIGVLGMDGGLLMTNGAARYALGPNDRSDKYQVNYFDEFEDPDLRKLIKPEQSIQDLCIIEFDISIYGDFLTFNYVFASEEYPEFLDFNDVFGFFISGPGIVGSENLAVLPGTNTPVSVSNINHQTNTQYYVPNGTGATPFDNSEIQYDGRTVVLRAEKQVTPCEVYHIKLAIADVDDSNLDSGVFLEEKSFSSKKIPHIEVSFEHDRFDYLIEGCNDMVVTVYREGLDLDQAISLDFKTGGTATERIDYNDVPDKIDFAPFQETVSFVVTAFQDTVNDPEETLILTLESQCDKFAEFDHVEVPIRERFTMNLPEITKCGNSEIELNENAIATDAYTWQDTLLLSCINCAMPLTSIEEDYVFQFTIYDSISTCEGDGMQTVDYHDITSDFDVVTDQCATSVDISFINNSTNADNYSWDFGDESSSGVKSPTHRYESVINKTESQRFVVTLTISNDDVGCISVSEKEIIIYEPLYVPNIISPNNDGINDYFSVRGIHPECWNFVLYNRWGRKVFDQHPFDNRFSPSDLVDGVYFYTIANSEGDQLMKGNFELHK